jgi:hypothetical protein
MKAAAMLVSNSLSVDAAIGWIDAAIHCLGAEDTALHGAQGRVLAEDIRADRAIPDRDCAMLDGFAIEASASLGASAYNPVEVPLRPVDAGDALPAGSNAVVPLNLAQSDERGQVELVEAAAPGDNVEQQGAVAPVGAMVRAAIERDGGVVKELLTVHPPTTCAHRAHEAAAAGRMGRQQRTDVRPRPAVSPGRSATPWIASSPFSASAAAE